MPELDYIIDFETNESYEVKERYKGIVNSLSIRYPDLRWNAGQTLDSFTAYRRYVFPFDSGVPEYHGKLLQSGSMKEVTENTYAKKVLSYRSLIASEKLALI